MESWSRDLEFDMSDHHSSTVDVDGLSGHAYAPFRRNEHSKRRYFSGRDQAILRCAGGEQFKNLRRALAGFSSHDSCVLAGALVVNVAAANRINSDTLPRCFQRQ